MEDQTLAAGAFKATCLKLMDEVAETGRSVVITKRGKPVAKLVPMEKSGRKLKSAFGAMAGMIRIIGDIESPYSEEELELMNTWPQRRWERANRPLPAKKRLRS